MRWMTLKRHVWGILIASALFVVGWCAFSGFAQLFHDRQDTWVYRFLSALNRTLAFPLEWAQAERLLQHHVEWVVLLSLFWGTLFYLVFRLFTYRAR